MNLFIMYMSGNTISIFPIMMVIMMMVRYEFFHNNLICRYINYLTFFKLYKVIDNNIREILEDKVFKINCVKTV